MKKMKKLLSMLLAVVMILAMAVPSFAASSEGEKGTITIDNPIAKSTNEEGNVTEYYDYYAYKIFDVTYDIEKTTYAYSIESNSPWYNIVSGYNTYLVTECQVDSEITLTKVASEDRYAATFNDLDAGRFAAYLKQNTPKDAVAIQFTTNDDKLTASVDLGYYFVTSDAITNTLCNLTTTDPNVTIHDKNDIPFDKTDDKESVEVGEVVNYTYEATVPDTTGFKEYDYIITDTMSAGLTFNNDIKVYVGDTELGVDKYEVRLKDQPSNLINGNVTATFELKIDVMSLKDSITKPIKVKYSATINDEAVSVISTNKAVLSFSNDPTDSKKHGELKDEETVYSAKVAIDKYARNNEDTADKTSKLAGAEFVLYRDALDNEEEGKYFYKYTPATEAEGNTPAQPAKVAWVTNQEDATVMITSDGENDATKGYAEFPGLKDGTYKLVETKAPDGYNLLDKEITITINGQNATSEDLSTLTANQSVENVAGTKLPSTGGIGTTIFYAAGIILMAGAVFFVVRRKRA